jgi:hypothetical protein
LSSILIFLSFSYKYRLNTLEVNPHRSGNHGDTLYFKSLVAMGSSKIQTPGHRYTISAWGKHIKSASPVELILGIDLSGGQDHRAASVQWFPWDEVVEDAWVHTEETVAATGPSMTIFLRAHHPQPAQGGATLFDDVSVRDLGP